MITSDLLPFAPPPLLAARNGCQLAARNGSQRSVCDELGLRDPVVGRAGSLQRLRPLPRPHFLREGRDVEGECHRDTREPGEGDGGKKINRNQWKIIELNRKSYKSIGNQQKLTEINRKSKGNQKEINRNQQETQADQMEVLGSVIF